MKAIVFGVLAALAGTAAQAGDQPVIGKPWIYYSDTGEVIYFYRSNTGVETYDFPTAMPATGTPVQPAATAPARRLGTVRPIGVPPQSSDALYSELLKEARARGLR